MKKMLFKYALAMLTLSISVCSCSDDNEPKIPGNDASDGSSVNEEAIMDSLSYQTLLTNLCTIDTLEDGSLKYTLINGKMLYPQDPETYYIGVDSTEEAENYVKATIIPAGSSAEETLLGFKFNLLDASLDFQRIDSDFELASLDIDIKELPEIKNIKFVNKEMWPDNDDTNKSSPFSGYSVWKKTFGNETRYYLCVRPCGYGSKGILLTVDGGWWVDPFRKYTHWQGEFDLYAGCATAEAWNAVRCMQIEQRNKMLSIIQNLKNFESKTKLDDFLKSAYNREDKTYIIGTHKYDHHLWWAYNCYDVTTYWYNLKSMNTGETEYTHKATPQNNIPNSNIYFNTDYNKDGWSMVSQ